MTNSLSFFSLGILKCAHIFFSPKNVSKLLTYVSAKNINEFAIFQDRNFYVTLTNNLLSF